MDDSLCSLDRLRAACKQQPRASHVYGDLAQCMARSLDVQIALLSICGKRRYCHRGSQDSTPADLADAIRIADAFLAAEGDATAAMGTCTMPGLEARLATAGSALMNSFAGARIRFAGRTIGTLCLFDRRPGAIRQSLLEDMLSLAEAVVACVHARNTDVQRRGDIHA